MNRRNILTSFAISTALAAAKSAKSGKSAPKSHTAKGPAGSFIEVDNRTRLFYKDWGTGKPVLFVHSLGVTADLWQYQMIDLIDRGLRCVAYDRRGHGRSSDPGGGYAMDILADDLHAIIESLDLRDVTVIGHSFGCREIVRYLSRHGSARIARAALVAPTLPFLLKTADNPSGLDQAAVDQLRACYTTDFPKWLKDNERPFVVPETSQPMIDWVKTMFLQASLQAVVECNRVGFETDFRAELAKLDLPTAVIQGDKDASAPLELTGRKTAALIPGCRLIVYEGAPHGLMLTHIKRLNADLLGFIAS
jgi:pimeloyl-ACP methyl ester carboxylesterase